MYEEEIRKEAGRQWKVGADPRHVEGWMRLEHPCLDGLSREQFDSEVAVALACMEASSAGDSEALAESFGL